MIIIMIIKIIIIIIVKTNSKRGSQVVNFFFIHRGIPLIFNISISDSVQFFTMQSYTKKLVRRYLSVPVKVVHINFANKSQVSTVK